MTDASSVAAPEQAAAAGHGAVEHRHAILFG
jgi:hypothetical protein